MEPKQLWIILFSFSIFCFVVQCAEGQYTGIGRPTSVTCAQIRCASGYKCMEPSPSCADPACRESARCVPVDKRDACQPLDAKCHVGCLVSEGSDGCETCSCKNTGCPLMKCRAECGIMTDETSKCRVCGKC